MTAAPKLSRWCQYERQVYRHGAFLTELCTVPVDEASRYCRDHGAECVCCGETFQADPADPESQACGDC